MQNLILGGVIMGIFKIQGCYVPQKSIFDLFGKKLPARMVTVKEHPSCLVGQTETLLRPFRPDRFGGKTYL